MIDMVKAMASLAEAQRKTMLGERLRMFAEMSDAERARMMKEMMSALVTLPREDQKKLIGTRLAVLMELDDASRMKVMNTHMQLMSKMPEQAQTGEVEIINELMDQMPEPARATAKAKMGDMMVPMLHQLHTKKGTRYAWCPGCAL